MASFFSRSHVQHGNEKRWRIVYKIENKNVYILIVVDSGRDIEDILFRRLLKDDTNSLDDE